MSVRRVIFEVCVCAVFVVRQRPAWTCARQDSLLVGITDLSTPPSPWGVGESQRRGPADLVGLPRGDVLPARTLVGSFAPLLRSSALAPFIFLLPGGVRRS